MPKIGRNKPRSDVPKSIRTGYSRGDKPFKWSFSKAAWEHKGWQGLTVRKFAEDIISKLQHYETQIWGDVEKSAGGKKEGRGTNNHFIPITELPRDEREYYIKAKLAKEYDKVFSLRLTARERLIGVVNMNVFHVLWYDPEHEIFKVSK